MAAGPLGKAIREKEARRLLKEVGGGKDVELNAERERILGLYHQEARRRAELTAGNANAGQATISITVVKTAEPNTEPEQIWSLPVASIG